MDVFVLQIPLASTTGVNENEITGFEVFPNPTCDKIQVKLPKGFENTLLEIKDICGRTLFSKIPVASVEEVDLSFLTEGAYILRAGALTKKLVVFK